MPTNHHHQPRNGHMHVTAHRHGHAHAHGHGQPAHLAHQRQVSVRHSTIAANSCHMFDIADFQHAAVSDVHFCACVVLLPAYLHLYEACSFFHCLLNSCCLSLF